MSTSRCISLALAGLLVVLAIARSGSSAPTLRARPADPMADRDGDLLPDAVEWVLMLDPDRPDTDGDGVDDFLHAVQHRPPLVASSQHATDDEMRLAVTQGWSGTEAVLNLHLLLRLVNSDLSAVTHFEPFLDHWGQRVPLAPLLAGAKVRMKHRVHPSEGLYVHLCAELGPVACFRNVLPCTLGAVATIGPRFVGTGTYLLGVENGLAAYLPIGGGEGVVQSLAGTVVDDPFWTANRVCLLRLTVLGSGPGGTVCEVADADCVYRTGRLACPPTCVAAKGRIMLVPDGMGLVTGGG